MNSYAFRRMATSVYSTTRNKKEGGVTLAAEPNLLAVSGTPRMPVDSEIVERYQVKSPRETYVIYFEGTTDIEPGDNIIDGTEILPIRAVGEWPSDSAFLEVIVEEVK